MTKERSPPQRALITFYDILEKTKLWGQRTDPDCQGFSRTRLTMKKNDKFLDESVLSWLWYDFECFQDNRVLFLKRVNVNYTSINRT